MNQESKRPIVDIICNWGSESFCRLTTENYIKPSFLPWWNNLTQRRTLLQFRILINKQPDINMLSQVISNNKTFRRRTLYKNSSKIYLLWAGIYLLKLLPGKFNTAISDFYLSLRLCFPFFLDYPILVIFPSVSKTH